MPQKRLLEIDFFDLNHNDRSSKLPSASSMKMLGSFKCNISFQIQTEARIFLAQLKVKQKSFLHSNYTWWEVLLLFFTMGCSYVRLGGLLNYSKFLRVGDDIH
jgi:hypothetical protein